MKVLEVVSCGALLLGAVALVGCVEEPPERIGITLDSVEQALGAKRAVVAPERPTIDVASFGLSRPVHWIEVAKCEPSEARCDVHEELHGYCYFDVSTLAWETAMGANVEGVFDDALRGEPAITGPIVYGELPTNAGWQSEAEPFEEGAVYGINAYVYEACDTEDVSCVHTKAVGCRFFTIQDGVPVTLPSTIAATHPPRE